MPREGEGGNAIISARGGIKTAPIGDTFDPTPRGINLTWGKLDDEMRGVIAPYPGGAIL